ncbi:hypothetical protein [Hymenobacter siberiensis]|uniref:hypothetical protein n=1 Tax=Hymenobacter siberiensis TaxID=2848396 RepID=UPI001C1E883D|nr:hypothetical protein [Hymenobacter siberiensis]
MRYKDRRKKEIEDREHKTAHRMSEPEPLVLHPADEPLPDRVALRVDGRTVRHVRVSKLERDLPRYAREFAMSVPELQHLIATRRYTPEQPATGIESRTPSWYVSDIATQPNYLFW